MNNQQVDQMIEKYLNGTATPYEQKLVEAWYHAQANQQALRGTGDFDRVEAEIWSGTLRRAGLHERRKPRKLWPRFAAAAAVILAFCAGLYFVLKPHDKLQPLVSARKIKPVPHPGGNVASLILANGKTISLTDLKAGQVARESNTTINKTADGHITYQHNNGDAMTVGNNTMITPKGGQYTVTLADGTLVTLNAASSLTFPTAFTGSNRTVRLSGEAYFEVAHNAAKPFRVINKGQVIEVLGTHFNVNGYSDDDFAKTTLLEGSVKISAGNRSLLLKPGQQAQLNSADHDRFKVVTADLAQAVAWKNGFFVFNDIDIREVMKVAARWYDVDVVYRSGSAHKKFGGTISRYKQITELLDNIREVGGINYRIEGRSVIIMD
jgi:transmembrane sensor